MSESKKTGLFSFDANVKSAKRIVVLFLVLGLMGWLGLRFLAGEKTANQTAAIILQRPIEIKNSIESVKASTMHWNQFRVPYSGTLSIEATVIKGNDLNIYLVPSNEIANLQARKEFKQIEFFLAEKSRNYKREGKLEPGDYAVVFHDKTLGILSDSSSDVKLIIGLEP